MTEQPNASESESGSSSHIPLEPLSESSRTPKPPVARPAGQMSTQGSLVESQDHRCPHCRAAMAEHQLMCMKCGFDQVRGVIVKPEIGEEEVESDAGAERPEYVPEGRLPVKVLLGIGALVLIGALIARGWYAPAKATSGTIIAILVLTLYQTLMHTATGVAAVAGAARLAGHRFTRLESVTAKMFLAFGTFQLVRFVQIPGAHPQLSAVVMLAIAAGAYFGMLMLLFKKFPNQASVIAVAHALLWVVVETGQVIASWASRELSIASQ